MNIYRIEQENFTVHQKSDLVLPEVGVVCITGPNGKGKSSFLEGVAWTLWGKTLRGTDPVPAGKRATTRVTFGSGVNVQVQVGAGASTCGWAQRSRKGAGAAQILFGAATSIKLSTGPMYHPSAAVYETASKAQAALELIVGGFDVWRRAQVFSSSDASLFTMATDGERKRLLEGILGLDRFDAALEKCRAKMRSMEAEVAALQLLLAKHRGQLAEASARRQEAERAIQSMGDSGLAAAMAEVAELDTLVGCAAEAVRQAQEGFKEADDQYRLRQQAVAELQGSCNHVDQRARRMANLGEVCPTCEQPVSAAHRGGAGTGMEAERAQLDGLLADARKSAALKREALDTWAATLNEATRAQAAVKQRRAVAAQALEAAQRLERVQAGSRQVIADASAVMATATSAIMAAEDDLDAITSSLAEQQAVEKVLGLRGVRAHLLAQALGGLAAAANSWLEMIAGGGLRVKLDPYTEKKTGGVSDAISLEIGGAGGGHGYRAASGGERRRIDVALMLALADVARAARGLKGGTMFFDEVFDALDEAGMDAVCEAMQDLAKDRCVVVISHSPELVKRLSPVQHVKL